MLEPKAGGEVQPIAPLRSGAPMSADGFLMPARKNQAPPDLR